ncbi:flavin-containing monooxygenase [Pseudophaeobacter arcticus]|uniref:flavin-containing monooxygenase n=1 Tax=Pseudophaeobacter arcticus TaxID=385492 RepID=UPI003A9771B7
MTAQDAAIQAAETLENAAQQSAAVDRFALIGAGPMGLAMAKLLKEQGIPFQGFELHSDVGGLWDIDAPLSTMYETAHLISSKKMTQFDDFPMDDEVAEYPSHWEMRRYFCDFARHFDLYNDYAFNCQVLSCDPLGDSGAGWRVSWRDGEGQEHSAVFAGVLIANGTLAEPNIPSFKGHFDGELIHSSQYRDPRQFADKRVLIVGAGNSGCDIAVDAIHHGVSCDISMRRGYYFVPKYVFGKPADTMGGAIRLPMWLKRRIDGLILKWFVGDPQKYGFPKPDYALYESHPVVNSLILFHAGHGDLEVRPDIDHIDGKTVHFADGSQAEYDMILTATGYLLHYPFIDKEQLNWQGAAPHLYLNCMHPTRDDLFVLGMVEASGLGWQGRHEQAEMVARYIKGLRDGSAGAAQLQREKSTGFERATGGMNYLKLARMAYYVDKATYRKAVTGWIAALTGGRA